RRGTKKGAHGAPYGIVASRVSRPEPTIPLRRVRRAHLSGSDPMLRLPPLTYRQPRSLADAVAILAGEGPAARLVAGGTDLLPNLKRRHQQAETLVSLMALPELRGIANGSGNDLRLGATATLSSIERDA